MRQKDEEKMSKVRSISGGGGRGGEGAAARIQTHEMVAANAAQKAGRRLRSLLRTVLAFCFAPNATKRERLR